MSHYYAMISTDEPDGIHKRVTVEADTMDEAKEKFSSQYGEGRVVKVWDDYYEAKFRGYST
jgi:hypothetical protein